MFTVLAAVLVLPALAAPASPARAEQAVYVGGPTPARVAALDIDDGGALIAGGNPIELGRVGSVKLPPLVHESANYSYTSTRDHYDFPTLYGSFRTPGKPDSSLEIQLDRVRRTATVVARSIKDDRLVASYMQGAAQRAER